MKVVYVAFYLRFLVELTSVHNSWELQSCFCCVESNRKPKHMSS